VSLEEFASGEDEIELDELVKDPSRGERMLTYY
jgi:hypothetical protein